MGADHTGRTYIVTGGSAGIGLGCAQALVRDGARVVIVGRDANRLDAALDLLGDGAVACVGDLADATLPQRALETAVAAFGSVSGALLSSGGPTLGNALTLTDDDWRQAFDATFLGIVRMCRTLVPALPPGGAIATVLSTTVWEPIPELAASNGLRPGLAMLLKGLARDVGPAGIRILGLAPGRIATARMGMLAGGSERHVDPEVPLGRWGTPEEFGNVASFVLSPEASYLTGIVIPVDGGLHRSL